MAIHILFHTSYLRLTICTKSSFCSLAYLFRKSFASQTCSVQLACSTEQILLSIYLTILVNHQNHPWFLKELLFLWGNCKIIINNNWIEEENPNTNASKMSARTHWAILEKFVECLKKQYLKDVAQVYFIYDFNNFFLIWVMRYDYQYFVWINRNSKYIW